MRFDFLPPLGTGCALGVPVCHVDGWHGRSAVFQAGGRTQQAAVAGRSFGFAFARFGVQSHPWAGAGSRGRTLSTGPQSRSSLRPSPTPRLHVSLQLALFLHAPCCTLAAAPPPAYTLPLPPRDIVGSFVSGTCSYGQFLTVGVDDERKSASLVVVCCLLFVAHFSSWPMARTTDTKNYLFGLVYRIFCCHIRGFVQGRELLQQEKRNFVFQIGAEISPRNFLRNTGYFLLIESAANIFLLEGGTGARVLHVRISPYANANPRNFFLCSECVSQKIFLCICCVSQGLRFPQWYKRPQIFGVPNFPPPEIPPPPQPWAVFAATRPSHACQKACTHLVCRPQRDPLMVCVRIPFGFWFPNGVFSRWLGHHVHEFQPKRPGIHGPPMRGAQW